MNEPEDEGLVESYEDIFRASSPHHNLKKFQSYLNTIDIDYAALQNLNNAQIPEDYNKNE